MKKNCVDRLSAPPMDHWAILRFDSISVPGWDRGDAPDTWSVPNYTWYDNEQEWSEDIRDLTLTTRAFVPLVVQVPIVETKITIRVRS